MFARLSGRRGGALLAVVLAAIWYAAWQYRVHDALTYTTSIYPIDDVDEWRYTACSRLVAHGYSLFSQVFSAQPPVLFVSVGAAMRVLGDSISTAHTVEAVFGLVGLLSAAWLAWQLGGPVAAGLTACLLAVSTPYLVYSHTVEAEGPMMALATLGLALIARSVVSDRVRYVALGGLAVSGAIMTKFFAVEALLPAAWLIATAEVSLQRRVRSLSLFLACAIVPLVLELALVAPGSQWRQVVSLHTASASLHLPGAEPSWKVLEQFLGFDAGLTILALGGICVLGFLGVMRELGFLVAWVGGTLLMLAYFHPLFPHHPPILLTGFAVAAGVGIAALFEIRYADLLRVARLTALVAGVGYLALLPRQVRNDRHVLYQSPAPHAALSALLDAYSGPHELVIADDLQVADQANRLVVPPLCDVSNVRLLSGYMSTSDLISITRRYRPEAVLSSFGLYTQVPGYLAWLHTHYRPVRVTSVYSLYLRR